MSLLEEDTKPLLELEACVVWMDWAVMPDSVAEGFLIPNELDAIGSRPSNEVME